MTQNSLSFSPRCLCCSRCDVGVRLQSATVTHQSDRFLLKTFSAAKVSRGLQLLLSLMFATASPCTHTRTHTHMGKLEPVQTPTHDPRMHVHTNHTHARARTHTRRRSREHGQQGHPSAMLHKGRRYNRFTVTLDDCRDTMAVNVLV